MNTLSTLFWAYRNKISNKVSGVVSMPHQGKKRGSILISYITSPFTLLPWEHKTDPHSSYWECREIARLFSVRGFDVDIINANEHRFVPKKPYKACIDIQQDLERLSMYLPASCKKVIHIDNPYYPEYNKREKARLDALKIRRGATISPRRHITDTKSVAVANFLEGLGNESVHATYAEFKKPIFSIPISVVEKFPFPEHKDFTTARKNFLYFGGGGAVLKGLDLATEAIATLPDITLHIVGPAAFEKDFAEEYKKELSLPNIICHGRPKMDKDGHITINGKAFNELTNECGAILYPSAAEGTSGAVIQAIHAGLIPIITPETGLNQNVGGMLLKNPTVESVRAAVIKFSTASIEKLQAESFASWTYVNEHHTKRTFSAAYGRFIDTVLRP